MGLLELRRQDGHRRWASAHLRPAAAHAFGGWVLLLRGHRWNLSLGQHLRVV